MLGRFWNKDTGLLQMGILTLSKAVGVCASGSLAKLSCGAHHIIDSCGILGAAELVGSTPSSTFAFGSVALVGAVCFDVEDAAI